MSELQIIRVGMAAIARVRVHVSAIAGDGSTARPYMAAVRTQGGAVLWERLEALDPVPGHPFPDGTDG